MTFFVATNGNDSNSGTVEKPFATIGLAQQAVKKFKEQEPNQTTPVVVEISGGTYYLNETLCFSPEDSGTENAPVVYRAAPGEKPVISGGRVISGWEVNKKGWWVVKLPDVLQKGWNFTQLFVNGSRRYRPRVQKEGYAFIAEEVPSSAEAKGKGYDRFGFNDGEFHSGWRNLTDVEVLCFHIWGMSRMRVKGVDEENRIVQFSGPTQAEMYYAALFKGNRFITENVYEALSRPGEWYLDRKSGTLTYIPMAGESVENTVIVAPRLDYLARVAGEVDKGVSPDVPNNLQYKRVEHLCFDGLTFMHANWVTPVEGYSDPQAETLLQEAAIRAENMRYCQIINCNIKHCGGWGIHLDMGSQHILIENCDLTDLGAGGIKIGETYPPSGQQPYIERNSQKHVGWSTVRNCLISQAGRIQPAATGILILHAGYNRIEHNEISDLYYSGISVGWCWAYLPSAAHHNVLEHNYIHNIGQNVLSDMGGFYMLGVAPGTVIRCNLIHDVKSFDYGGWGIYFDQGSADLLATENIACRCSAEPFMQNQGRDNHVINNIFAYGEGGQINRGRAEEHTAFTFERNIVYWNNSTPLFSKNIIDNQLNDLSGIQLDKNIYFNAGGYPIFLNDEAFAQVQAQCGDQHSIVADPLFVNPENGDFTLKEDSPAKEIGFKPFDMSKVGLLTRRNERVLPTPPSSFPTDITADMLGRELKFDAQGIVKKCCPDQL